jgi:cytochrome P450
MSATGPQSNGLPPQSNGLPPGPPLPLPVATALTWTVTIPFLERCRGRYGPLFTLRTFPWGTSVFVSDPQLLAEVFRGDPNVYHAGEGNQLLAPIVGEDSLLLLDEPDHIPARRRLLGPLHGDELKTHAQTVERIVNEEVDRWPIGQPFALFERLQAITFEVVLQAVMGVRDSHRHDALRTILPAAVNWDPTTLAMWVIPPLQHIGRWRRHQRAVNEMNRLIAEEVAARRLAEDITERPDVLSKIMADPTVTDRALCDDVKTVLIAGEGTTAAALSWALERLLRHPHALARVRDGDNDYVEAVIKETLRVRPVIPAVARRLTAPVELAGYAIPAGATIVPALALAHTDPTVFADPASFSPERFLGGEHAPDYSFVPFGGGVRRCPGASLATLEMRIALPTILKRAQLQPHRARREATTHRNITLIPRRGTRVIRTA